MNWYVKKFSALTKVSVRMLHHYDSIDLLKPSLRSSANYRLYSEGDLLKLQRIVALRFFGFSLQQIKVLVEQDVDVIEQLKVQQRFLHKQLQHQRQAISAINELVVSAEAGKHLEWSKIVASIEGYDMTRNMKRAWMDQAFSPDQLKVKEKWEQHFSPQQIVDMENRWADLVGRVKANIDKDPASAIGQKLAKEWLVLIDEMYGGFEELADAVWLSYKHNKIPNAPFDQNLWDFIDKAQQALKFKK